MRNSITRVTFSSWSADRQMNFIKAGGVVREIMPEGIVEPVDPTKETMSRDEFNLLSPAEAMRWVRDGHVVG